MPGDPDQPIQPASPPVPMAVPEAAGQSSRIGFWLKQYLDLVNQRVTSIEAEQKASREQIRKLWIRITLIGAVAVPSTSALVSRVEKWFDGNGQQSAVLTPAQLRDYAKLLEESSKPKEDDHE